MDMACLLLGRRRLGILLSQGGRQWVGSTHHHYYNPQVLASYLLTCAYWGWGHSFKESAFQIGTWPQVPRNQKGSTVATEQRWSWRGLLPEFLMHSDSCVLLLAHCRLSQKSMPITLPGDEGKRAGFLRPVRWLSPKGIHQPEAALALGHCEREFAFHQDRDSDGNGLPPLAFPFTALSLQLFQMPSLSFLLFHFSDF